MPHGRTKVKGPFTRRMPHGRTKVKGKKSYRVRIQFRDERGWNFRAMVPLNFGACAHYNLVLLLYFFHIII
ncbi:hypothetical protein VNO78_15494 [Psophocarpus tetragonolobus]|uniref:Uncharacterized protein n=1 Tax=Psophocarpus tetragonolobus TaxID=3891 RepID=A0AAN9SE37_PSOTE